MKRLPLAVVLMALPLAACEQLHKDTATFTLESKDRQCHVSDGTSSCAYMLFGTDGQVFRNEDALVLGDKWKVDSSSLQATLHVGKTYKVSTIGWRIPWLSMYPNVIHAEEVTTK